MKPFYSFSPDVFIKFPKRQIQRAKSVHFQNSVGLSADGMNPPPLGGWSAFSIFWNKWFKLHFRDADEFRAWYAQRKESE